MVTYVARLSKGKIAKPSPHIPHHVPKRQSYAWNVDEWEIMIERRQWWWFYGQMPDKMYPDKMFPEIMVPDVHNVPWHNVPWHKLPDVMSPDIMFPDLMFPDIIFPKVKLPLWGTLCPGTFCLGNTMSGNPTVKLLKLSQVFWTFTNRSQTKNRPQLIANDSLRHVPSAADSYEFLSSTSLFTTFLVYHHRGNTMKSVMLNSPMSGPHQKRFNPTTTVAARFACK